MSCDPIIPRCKAQCCGIAPIPIDIWNANKDKAVNPYNDIMRDHKDNIFPMTENLKCTFLTADYKCNIYDQRPDVCRKYSDESHPMLTCSYIDKSGKARSRQDSRRVERMKEKFIIKFYKRFTS